MDGYTLLSREGYIVVYLLAAVMLAVSAVMTFIGVISFGALVWWPTLAVLAIVFFLEVHSVYSARSVTR